MDSANQESIDATLVKTTVHLNPRFKNIHINPKFIQNPVTATPHIHVNPKFLAKPAPDPIDDRPIVVNTRRKLIRNVVAAPVATETVPIKSNEGERTSADKFKATAIVQNKFKLDRRIWPRSRSLSSPNSSLSMCKTVKSRYRLKRVINNAATATALTPRRTNLRSVSRYQLRRIASASGLQNSRRSLMNINGVFYKSTPTCKPNRSQLPANNNSRTLSIRGESFLVTGNGNRLQRVIDVTHSRGPLTTTPLKRIEFGGVTFIANSEGTAFERTNSHEIRNYLSQAKQKSITILANKYRKNNIPCLIYRRIGKCLAKERGKCNKVHDPNQVAICKKFLKGHCPRGDQCLLSHKTSLSKMPTCSFYLDGCCVTPNCPYLHKKVNKNVEICSDFRLGFCKLAEKCPKRHELTATTNKMQLRKVSHSVGKVNKSATTTRSTSEGRCGDSGSGVLAMDCRRYYNKEMQQPPVDGNQMEIVLPKRPKIGSLLSYIPL